jgi:hypothetical protein
MSFKMFLKALLSETLIGAVGQWLVQQLLGTYKAIGTYIPVSNDRSGDEEAIESAWLPRPKITLT